MFHALDANATIYKVIGANSNGKSIYVVETDDKKTWQRELPHMKARAGVESIRVFGNDIELPEYGWVR